MKNVWPSKEELGKGGDIDLAPYGVIAQYSSSIYEVYDKKLIGVVTSRSSVMSNGDRKDFVYSLLISQAKNDAAQVKIFEIEIQDDGWYPAKIYAIKPSRELLGIAENEKQLRVLVEKGIQSEFVKNNIRALLYV